MSALEPLPKLICDRDIINKKATMTAAAASMVYAGGLGVQTNTYKWATVACDFCTLSHLSCLSFTQNSSVGL